MTDTDDHPALTEAMKHWPDGVVILALRPNADIEMHVSTEDPHVALDMLCTADEFIIRKIWEASQ